MKKNYLAIMLICAFVFNSCTEGGELETLTADAYTVSGAADSKQLVPTANGNGSASLSGWYDEAGNSLTLNLSWSDLWLATESDMITGLKFYGPAAPGANGPLTHTINFTNANASGSVSLSLAGHNGLVSAEREDLLSGKWYYIITSEKNPEGLVRGALNAVKRDPTAKPVNLVKNIVWDAANKTILKIGDKSTLNYRIEPVFATNREVTWQSSDPAIASVDQEGIVTANAQGFATITATAADGSSATTSTLIAVNYILQETELDRKGWTVTASSEKVSDGGGVVATLDGNFSTYWHSMWGPNEPLPHWILVDMKQTYDVSKVIVRRRTGNTDTKTVVVETSLDNVTFNNAGTISATADMNPLAFNVVKARYIKFTVTESNRVPNASISELYVSETKWIPSP